MPRFASSVALRIASGTSLALPVPKPTLPRPSPTTTSAAKPKRRPPFTTFATRLIPTSFSISSGSSRCMCSVLSLLRAIDDAPYLKLKTSFSCSICKRFHPSVKKITTTVKYYSLNTGLCCAFSNRLADYASSCHITPGFA